MGILANGKTPCSKQKLKGIIGFVVIGGFLFLLHGYQVVTLPGGSSPYLPVTKSVRLLVSSYRNDSQEASPVARVPTPLFLERNLWTPKSPPEGILSQLAWAWKLSGNDPSLAALFPQTVSKAKEILFLDDVIDGWEWKQSQGRCPGLIGPRCRYSKVNLTEGKRLEGVDAVISAYDSGHLQTKLQIPASTVRVFYLGESSFHAHAILRRTNDLLASFNTRISDIPMPYAAWISHRKGNMFPQTKKAKNYAEGKSKMAAIFVSNCQSVNRRLGLVKKLQEFIPVDIYGGCGSQKCRMQERNNCFAKLSKEYKFYLAFENSNCREYITEKLFENAFMNDIIPVVMGAQPEDYKAIAPPHSYIQAEDFGNVQELAGYLKALDADDEAYNGYFRWKDSGQFLRNPSSHFLCVTCAMLWYGDIVALPPRQRPLVWNNTNEFCLPRGKWRWKTQA